DASSRQADLRLDTQQGQLDSGAVVPGQPDESLLIARIESDDPEMLMPPPSSKRTLTPQQKQLLRDWIEQGAVVEGHWAFQAPTRPSIPDVRQQDWPLNAIDRFVLSRLESMGLQPSPPADRETLIRRLTLDL